MQNRNAIFRLKRYDFKYSNEHEPQYFRSELKPIFILNKWFFKLLTNRFEIA